MIERNGPGNGRRLFYDLLQKYHRHEFDDDYLCLAIEFRKEYPYSEKFEIFYALYAMHYGNYDVALEQVKKAFEKRPLDFMVLKILVAVHQFRGDLRESTYYQGLCNHFFRMPMHMELPEDKVQELMDLLSLAFEQLFMRLLLPDVQFMKMEKAGPV